MVVPAVIRGCWGGVLPVVVVTVVTAALMGLVVVVVVAAAPGRCPRSRWAGLVVGVVRAGWRVLVVMAVTVAWCLVMAVLVVTAARQPLVVMVAMPVTAGMLGCCRCGATAARVVVAVARVMA